MFCIIRGRRISFWSKCFSKIQFDPWHFGLLGCGRYAGGQGYNSIGHFCGGWAGNCGDGGIGGSTWYLVCDRCREKYLREKQTAAREKVMLQNFVFPQHDVWLTTLTWIKFNVLHIFARLSNRGKNLCKWKLQGHYPLWRPIRWFEPTPCSCCHSAVLLSPACCAITLPGLCTPSCSPASRREYQMNPQTKWAVCTSRHWQGICYRKSNTQEGL